MPHIISYVFGEASEETGEKKPEAMKIRR